MFVLVVARAASTLLEEFERLLREARALALFCAAAIAASMLLEERERLLEDVLRAASLASMLEEELESDSDDACTAVIDAFKVFSRLSTLGELTVAT